MFDWGDVRHFLAAARGGAFNVASAKLGVDTATVSRRVARLESALKATLFVRSPAGLQLTSAGVRLSEVAMEAEAAMQAVERAADPDISGGTVRIGTAEGFGSQVLAPALPAFRLRRPTLRIELAANAGFLSPTRREVDLAVTLSAPTDARLLVEPLTDYQLALYASRGYLERTGPILRVDDLRRREVVGYVDDLLYSSELRYLDEVLPGLQPALSSSSIRAQREILLSGGGVGVLPCFLASGLVQVVPSVVIRRRFWVSTLRDVASTARVRAVRSWLQSLVADRNADLCPFGAGAVE
jgi:DNA-binding transcriptional LysR family regulator